MQPIINTILRKDKQKDGKCAIVLQVYLHGSRRQVFTGLYVKEEDFDNGVVKNITNRVHYNNLIASKRNDLEREYLTQAVGGSVSLTQVVKKEKRFFPYAYDMLDNMKSRCKDAYLKRYKYLLDSFKEWAGDILIADVTPELLKDYEMKLFKDKITSNTIARNIKKIKQVLNHYGLPVKYKTQAYKQPLREHLTSDEVEKIYNSNYDHVVKWYFLLSCYTGLRYGDMIGVKGKVINNNGNRLVLSTTKSGQIVSIKLSDKVVGMINRIDGPIPTNEQCNRVLKAIAAVCEINKKVTFHMARHSFAVNAASLGFPIEVVSKLLGHSSIRTTAIYYKITDTKIDEWMDRFE